MSVSWIVSQGELLDIVENYFQILTVHTVYERVVLKESFFENVREMDSGEKCQKQLRFLAQNPEVEDVMIRLVAQKRRWQDKCFIGFTDITMDTMDIVIMLLCFHALM